MPEDWEKYAVKKTEEKQPSDEWEQFAVKKKGDTNSKNTTTNGVSLNSTSSSNSKSSNSNGYQKQEKSDILKKITGKDKFLPLTKQQIEAGKKAIGQGSSGPIIQQNKPLNTNDNITNISDAFKQKSDNTNTVLPNLATEIQAKREVEDLQRTQAEREKNNPFSTVNLADKYKKSAKQLSGNNDVEKLLNYGEISGYNKFVVDLLDENDKELYQVKLGMEDIWKSNKIYDAQLKSGAITQEQYDAVKKNNDKLLIDLNTAYVDKLKKRNSEVDEQIKEAQQQLAYGIEYIPFSGVYKKLTPQEAQDKKDKIKYLTGLKNDVLIDVNNPVKSLEKHSGYQQAEKEGLIPDNATNTQRLKIYSNILAYKANELAKELGYDTKDAKSLLGDNLLDANSRKMAWESFKSLIVGSNDKEKEFVKTMGELQAIAPIVVLNKNNLTLNEGYTSNIVSSFRKSVAPMFSRNQVATDADRSRLTNEAFAGAGISNDGVSPDYVAKQEDTKKESDSLGKTVARTTGDVLGIGVKIGVINPILELPLAGIEMTTGVPIFKGLNKALSTSKQAQAAESSTLAGLAETAKTAEELSQIKKAQKVLDIAKVVSEKIPNNFLTRTLYNTVKAGTVHEIQGEVNKELEGFANFGVGAVNNLIGMPINSLGNIAIKMFGKDAPMFILRVIDALKSGTAMTGTMAGMVTVNAAQNSNDFEAFKDVLNEHFGTGDKRLRFVAENFLLGLVMHAVNAPNISGGFKTLYEKTYSELSDTEKKKVDEFVSSVNEETNNFETETKDAVDIVSDENHTPITTEKEIKEQESLLGIAVAKESSSIIGKTDTELANKITKGGIESLTPEEKDYYTAQKENIDKLVAGNIKKTTTEEVANPSVEEAKEEAPKQESGRKSLDEIFKPKTEEKKATIESAVIEIGGKMYEGKNHAEAILKAKADGQDISKVDRQAEGKFKLSDGSIIDRAEAKKQFGQDRSELIIPQDEAAKQANKDYAEITKGLKNEQTNQNTPEQQDNGNSTGMAGSEQNSKAVRTKSEQGKLSNEDKIQQNATTEVQKQITEVEKIISELEDNPNSPFHKLVNLDEQKQKLSELQKKEAEVKKESAQPVLPETKAQKAANPILSETPKEEVEVVSGSALKDVEEDSEKWYKAKKTIKDKDGNDIKLTIDKNKDDKHFYIKATDSNGKEVGSALFETSDGEVWSGNEIEVNEANRRKGIMSAMYDFAESEGHPLEPTKTLSKEGKAFWDNRKAPTQYTEASGVSGSALKDVESTAKALEGVKFNANFNLPLEQTKSPKQVSEAYHKAKADGTNPELVKAVEDLLGKAPTQYTEAATPKDDSAIQSGGEQKLPDQKEVPIEQKQEEVTPTTETNPNVEAKKADIERRRREDLQKGQLFLMNDGTYGGSRLVSLEEYSTIQIQENNLDSDITKWDYNTFNDTGIFVNLSLGVAYIVPNNSYNGKKAEVVKVFINKITKRFDLSNPRIINTPNIELVAKAANIDSKELYNEVLNAITKYDAELATLEEVTPTTETNPNVEAKKADIERRKQEVRGDALERIGIDRVGFDGKQRQDWKDAKNQDLKIATNHAIERLSKNPNVKIASLPPAYANAIKAELEIHGVKTTDKTSISEIIEKLKEINSKYDAELATLEETSGVSGSALKDVKIRNIKSVDEYVEPKEEDIKDGNTFELIRGNVYDGKGGVGQTKNIQGIGLSDAMPSIFGDGLMQRSIKESESIISKATDRLKVVEAEIDRLGNKDNRTTKEFQELEKLFKEKKSLKNDLETQTKRVADYNKEKSEQDKIDKENADLGLVWLTNQKETARSYAEQLSKVPKAIIGERGDPKVNYDVVKVTPKKIFDLTKLTDENGGLYENNAKLEEIENILGIKLESLPDNPEYAYQLFRGRNAKKVVELLKEKGYDVVRLKEGNQDNFVLLNLKETAKAPTQYTEAATPAKKESGGVSGSALKDVGDTFENREAIEDNLKDLGDDVYYHGSDDISYLSSKEDFNTVSNTKNAESKYVNLTPKAGTAVSYSIRQQRIGEKSGVAAFKLKGKGYTMTNADIKTLKSNADYEAFYDKKKSEGYDFVKVPQDANDIVVLNNNAIEYVGKKFNKDALTKATTQYTEAATPKDDSAIQSGGEQKLPDQKVLFNDAIQYYKDKGLSYEEVKSRLDKNEVDYEEADLKDAWDGKEVPPGNFNDISEKELKDADNGEERQIGTKKAINDALYGEMGLKPLELPPRRSGQENLDAGKRMVDSGERNPVDLVDYLLSKKEDPNSAQISPNDEPVMLYYRMQLDAKGKELNNAISELQDKVNSNPQDEKSAMDLETVKQQQLLHYDEVERAINASQIGGNVWSKYGNARQTAVNEQGLLINSINRIKAIYGDDMPAKLSEELKVLQQKYDSLVSDNEKIQAEFIKKAEETHKAEVDKYIIEAYEKGKKDGSAGKATKTSKVKLEKAKAEIAEGLQDFLQAVGGLNMAAGNVMPSITKALKKIGNGLIKAGEATAENVFDKIVEYIEKNTGKKPDIENYRGEFEKKEEKKAKISRKRVKQAIENGAVTVDDVVQDIQKDFPDMTEREIKEDITNYGKTKESSQEPDDVATRKLIRMAKYDLILEDIENGKRPPRTGLQRDNLDVEERAKLKEIREGLKKLKPSDEDLSKKLKTSQDAIETRLKKRIEDLKRQIDAGKKDTRIIKPISTPDIEKLRDEVKKLEDDLDEVVSKNRHSDTLQELKDNAEISGNTTISKADVDNGLISDLVQAHIEKGTPINEVQKTIFDELKAIFPDTTEAQVRDAILKQGEFGSGKKTRTDLQNQVSELKKQLNYNKKIEDLQNGIEKETKAKGAQSDEVKALQKQLADAKKESVNKFPNLSSVELERQIKTNQSKIDKGDYFKVPFVKKKWLSDERWIQNNQRLTNLKNKLREHVKDAMESEKSLYMRFLDAINRWGRRVIFFGSNAVYTKLASAAMLGSFAHRIPEQLTGLGYKKLFPRLGNISPESSYNIEAEKKFYEEFLNPKKFIKNTWDIAKTGQTELSKELGHHSNKYHIPIVDLFAADSHIMIKDPVKRATFEATFLNHLKFYSDNNVDYSHPLIMESARQAAYKAAEYEIFQDSGSITKNNAISIGKYFNEIEKNAIIENKSEVTFEKIGGNLKYTIPFLKNFFIPINTVPSNIVRRVFLPFKIPYLLVKAMSESSKIKKGISTLSTEEADLIFRQLKKGTIGAAYWTLGFCIAGQFAGGLYTRFYPDKKRKKGIAKSNELDFLGMDINHNIQHTPQLTALQMGATARIVYSHYVDDKDANAFRATMTATTALGGSAIDQMPTPRFTKDALNAASNPYDYERFKKNLVRRVGYVKGMNLLKMMGYGDGYNNEDEDNAR